MARERMITRTITVTTYEVLGIDLNTLKTETRKVTVPGKVDGKIAEKLIKEGFADEQFAVALISKVNVSDVLYGMPEEDFIKYAAVIPPRDTGK